MSTDTIVAPSTGTTIDTDMTHYVCCEVPVGGAGPTLCGAHQLDECEGVADAVDCVVCNDLADDWVCPLSGRPCPTGE